MQVFGLKLMPFENSVCEGFDVSEGFSPMFKT
jgi:hypothetical protein